MSLVPSTSYLKSNEIEAADPDFKRLDGIFSRLKADDFRLCYGSVNIDTAEIHVFADASFATNKDLSSQLGYVILLVDDKGNCSFLSWSTSKCKGVTRSVLAAELYALAHGFDAGFALSHTVCKLLGRKMKVQVFTDSRTLFDSITSLCSMTEKSLLIDIYCLREAYRNGELANLSLIRTQHNISDALTTTSSRHTLSTLRSPNGSRKVLFPVRRTNATACHFVWEYLSCQICVSNCFMPCKGQVCTPIRTLQSNYSNLKNMSRYVTIYNNLQNNFASLLIHKECDI